MSGATCPLNFPTSFTNGIIVLAKERDLATREQDSDISKLIWPVQDIISICSRSMTLKPGDIIMTGTPEDVGPVQRGELMTGGSDRLGETRIAVAQPRTKTAVPRGPIAGRRRGLKQNPNLKPGAFRGSASFRSMPDPQRTRLGRTFRKPYKSQRRLLEQLSRNWGTPLGTLETSSKTRVAYFHVNRTEFPLGKVN